MAEVYINGQLQAVDTHIAQVQLESDLHWVQYRSWFYVRNFNPDRDYAYNPELAQITLRGNRVITEFHQHFPNLAYTTVSL